MLELNKIYNMDCLEGLKQIPDNYANLILTDPPYNISQENDIRDRSKFTSPIMRSNSPLRYDFGDWDKRERKDFLNFTRTWLKECCRILKDGGAIISFFSKQDISFLGWEAENFNIRTRVIFTWCKSNPVPSFRKVNYLSATEYVWIGSKGQQPWTFNFKLQKEMCNYMITSNSSSYGETEHPTEKPLELIGHFIEIHTNENDIVVDPFMGGGTTAVACVKLNRRFLGFEIDKNYYDISLDRIKKTEFEKKKVVSIDNWL